MKAYLLKRSDFTVQGYWDAISYTLYPGTDNQGQVVIDTELTEILENNWLYFYGSVWLITGNTPKDGKTTIKLNTPIKAFDRKVIYAEPSAGTSVETFIGNMLTSKYKNLSDAVYKMGYLNITASGSTTFVEPELESGDLFQLSEYMFAALASGVDIKFEFNNALLNATIAPMNAVERVVIMGDNHNQLVSESYSNDAVAKVTVRQEDEVEEGEPQTYTNTIYYLDTDGNLSTSAPVHRAEGIWDVVVCRHDDDPLEKAKEVIKNNEWSHKIEFYSDMTMNLYDPVTIKFKRGTIFKTQINKIQHKSTDNRTLYTCGNLPVTLTDILNNKEDKE